MDRYLPGPTHPHNPHRTHAHIRSHFGSRAEVKLQATHTSCPASLPAASRHETTANAEITEEASQAEINDEKDCQAEMNDEKAGQAEIIDEKAGEAWNP